MNNARCLFMTPEIRELAKKFPGETEESVKNLVGLWQEKRHKSPDTYPSELELKRFIKELRNPAEGNQAEISTNNLNKGENNNENDKGRVAQGVQEGTQGHGNRGEADRKGSGGIPGSGNDRTLRPQVLGRTRDYVAQRLNEYLQGREVVKDLTDTEFVMVEEGDSLTYGTIYASHKIDKKLKRKGIKKALTGMIHATSIATGKTVPPV